MTHYDHAESRRLAQQAREDDRRMPAPPWDHEPAEPPAGSCGIRGPTCSCREDDLAAWCWRHDGVAEFVPIDVADAIIRQRGNLAAVADQLDAARARVSWYESAVCALHDQVDLTAPSDPVGVALTRAGLERRPAPDLEQDDLRTQLEVAQAQAKRMRTAIRRLIAAEEAWDIACWEEPGPEKYTAAAEVDDARRGLRANL